MEEIDKNITTIMSMAHKSIKELLMHQFPNLYFYISPTGNISCWIKTSEGRDGIGISMAHKINVGQILYHHWKYLAELNDEVEIVRMNPKEYFYCTECGKVKPKSEFEDSVFAGWYCRECAKKPEIKALIEESHQKGFYD